MNSLRVWHFLIIPLLFFCIDSSFFFLFDHETTYLICSWIIITSFKPRAWYHTLMLLLLISLESFLFYGIFGLPLLYMLPALLLTSISRRMLYITKLYPPLIATTCILLQILAIELGLLGLPLSPWYTMGKIIATIIVINLFSLTQNFTGQNETIAHI